MKKRLIFISLTLAFLSIFFIFNIYAATENNVYTITNISPLAFEKTVDLNLSTFSETNELWDSDNQNINVTVGQTTTAFPNISLTGDTCLIVRNKDAKSSVDNTISKTYTQPLDLSEYNFFAIAFNCNAITSGEYRVTVKLISTNYTTFVSECTVSPDCWNGIYLDVSDWEGRDGVKEIIISAKYMSETTPVALFEYCIDSISVCISENAPKLALFSAEGYTSQNGEVTQLNTTLDIQASGNTLTLASEGFLYNNIEKANAIEVIFRASAGCNSVKLEAFDKNDYIIQTSNTLVHSTDGLYTAILSLNCSGINNINVTLTGVKSGLINILSIKPYSEFTPKNSGDNIVDTCVINPNTGEILIRGTIGEKLFNDNKHGEIYLFSHNSSDNTEKSGLSDEHCIAKMSIMSEDFIFRIDYGKDNDERQFLYNKYTVAVKTQTGYTVIGSPRFITNPESYTQNIAVSDKKTSGKGIYGHGISFMQEIDASNTVMWVDIGKFFTVESAGGSRFECGGNLFYYNNDYFSSLNSMISNYGLKDIKVTVIFVVSDTGNESLNKLLIHKNANLDATYCAYNTQDKSGLMYLRAISEFFAQKYCSKGLVDRVVFGDSVAMAKNNYNMGDNVTLGEFVSEYAKGLRVIYTAVKSYSPKTQVYTYIDDNWDTRLPFDIYTRYDNFDFLRELNKCISDSGNIEWGVAQNPYPQNADDYFSYNDNLVTSGLPSARVTFKNLEVLTSFLKSGNILYGNTPRDLIIIEKTHFSGMDEQTETADYVYNSYVALVNGVSAYFTNRKSNYNNAMKYIDTNLSLTMSSFAPDVLGVSTWESIIKGFSTEKITKKNITEGVISLTKPKSEGSIVLYDFSKGDNDWKRYGFTEKITSDSTVGDRQGLMSLFLGNVPAGESRGIVKKFDTPYNMSATPILHFTLNIASLPTNVQSAPVKVILTSGNEIHSLSCNVKETVWTDVYCDFSGVSGISRVDSIMILFEATENYYDSPQVLISSINGVSKEYNNEKLAEILYGIDNTPTIKLRLKTYVCCGLGTLCVVCTVIFMWRRTAKINKRVKK